MCSRPRSSALRGEGLLGDDVCGTGRRLQIEIFTSPGGYILGEESALLECMEGHRGEPRNKPPFPGLFGLWGKPTLMNSVETFADVPIILERGADWWKEQGINGATGLKFFAVSGHVEQPDVYCVRAGSTARDLIDLAGGVTDGREVGAIQPGGASSNFLGPDALDVPLDWKPLQEAGSMLGSGALIVMAEGTNLLAAGTNVLRFFRNESCGKCVPCRVGSTKAHTILSDLLEQGKGVADVPEKIPQLEETLRMTSICGLGQVALGPGAQRARHGPRRRRGARAPEGPRRHRNVGASPRGRPATHREFFAVRTVAETLAGFRPARRTGIETVALAGAHGRVPAEPVRAPHDLPGFARATVDGFAVRAADTYGASEGLPSYLDVTGAVVMGRAPEVAVAPGIARRDADRRRAPRGRGRGGDGRAHPGDDARARSRSLRPSRRARAWCAPTRTRAPAPSCCPPAARCARRTSACSRPRASTEVRVHARPRVAIVSTGDEVVPPGDGGRSRSARSATRTRPALAALVRDAGGEPDLRGIVPDDRARSRASSRDAVASGDVVVVSAGSSVGARDETAAVVAGLGEPGIWATDRAAPRQADAPGRLRRRAGDRAAGQPALGARRVPAHRDADRALVGGMTDPPPEPTVRARLERDVPSAAGRLDVVQVTVRDGVATPLSGPRRC